MLSYVNRIKWLTYTLILMFSIDLFAGSKGLLELNNALIKADWDALTSFTYAYSEGGYAGGQGPAAALDEIKMCRNALSQLIAKSVDSMSEEEQRKIEMLPTSAVRQDDYDGPIINFKYRDNGELLIEFVSCSYH